MPIVYGGLLPKAYGTRNMDAQRCANTLKLLKQAFSFRKEPKTTTLTKSKPCSHVLSCSAMFNDLLWGGLCKMEGRSLHNYYRLTVGRFFLDRALHAIAFSALDIGVMYLWPWV